MPRFASGTVVANKYELVRELAQGGMGCVWIARHRELDADVALKVILDSGRDRSTFRFRREAQAAAKLKSPYVTQIHDYGTHDDAPYIVMELLQGEGLDARLRRVKRIAIEPALAIFTQLCRGLTVAHDAGIVHRDLKPSNVFLAKSAGEEIAKILDFGIAKDLNAEIGDAERTSSGALVGSPAFMSPEQTKGRPLDHRSDLWSLGVVLFEMLTGERPFAASNFGDLVAKICYEEIPKPSQLEPSLGGGVDEFFEVALARRPEHRFQCALHMAEALAAVVRGEPLPPLVPSLSSVSHSDRKGRDDATVDLSSSDAASSAPDGDDTVAPLSTTATSLGKRAGTTVALTPPTPARSRRSLLLVGALVLASGGVAAWQARAPKHRADVPSSATPAIEAAAALPPPVAAPASATASSPIPTASAARPVETAPREVGKRPTVAQETPTAMTSSAVSAAARAVAVPTQEPPCEDEFGFRCKKR
jgi:serine/threonine-protein kinase